MPDSASRWRSYLGLALVILAYVGGIIGWSWAALTVNPDRTAPDTTQVVGGPGEGTLSDRAGDRSASSGPDR